MAVCAVNNHLDALVMARVMHLIAARERLHVSDTRAVANTQAIFAEFEARLEDRRCITWPDPLQLAAMAPREKADV